MVDAEVFNTRISDTFERFQTAFELLRTEHNPASIKVTRKLDELKIEVLKVGTYSLRPDVQKRCLVLVSPVSGMYTYELEEASGFWKSTVQVHIIDDLLVREFCKHSKGWLSF